MDLNEIRKLVRLMEKADLTEVEIDDSKTGVRVHLCRGGASEGQSPPVVQVLSAPMAAGAPAAMPAPPPAAGAGGEAPAASVAQGGAIPAGAEVLKSPMVGTFYRAPSPDSEPFCEVGNLVEEESVLCIIEAMKVMNEIKAEMRGEVLEILVENGEPVEFGQPLFLIKKA
ncbi:MAG TPA: acetyl-CoA carboxylase biotin carboxyl carrier protein [Planctomycetes bacterium]|nr:acetyl-CoA carboxylase biotin carboxyl carrier protein [Planctomycetota bacterium]